jgi:hypothetical protein
MLCAVGAQRVDYYQQSDRILAAIERQAAQQVIEVGALGGLEPSWVFYGGRAIRELSVDPAQELTAAQVALQFFAAGRSSTIPAAAAGDDAFASQRNSAGDHNQVHPLRRCLITTDEQLRELQHEMPGRWDVVAAAPRFLKPGRLLLITLAENPPPL